MADQGQDVAGVGAGVIGAPEGGGGPGRGRWGPALERIDAMDACRGLALLGIFMVNIQLFSGPLGRLLSPEVGEGLTRGDWWAHHITGVFFTGKFYAQFSMLFGMGLVLQMTRARAAGKSFVPMYLRRLLFLVILGACHANLLWYGDILFTYAFAGAVLLMFRQVPAKVMFALAGALLLWTCVLTAGTTVLLTRAEAAQKERVKEEGKQEKAGEGGDAGGAAVPHGGGEGEAAGRIPAAGEGAEHEKKSAMRRLRDGFRSGEITDPSSPGWMEAETQAYRYGGFWQAAGMRSLTWASMLVFELMGFGWHVLALFFLGAGLLKAGIFNPEKIHWHRGFVLAGALVGIPLAGISDFAHSLTSDALTSQLLASLPEFFAGPLMGLMYIGLVTLAVHSRTAPRVTGALQNVGRMALTNYLMQTVAATSIFYWFGLGLFGQVSGLACMGIVVGVYLVQVALSALWMRRFLYGPMEWLWRSVTYLRWQPMRRGAKM